MPIGVQLAANWHSESTVLHIASLLESLSPVVALLAGISSNYYLRLEQGDQRTSELVDELSARDTRFRGLWERHAVVNMVDRPPVRFAHPLVGELTLTRDNLAIDGPDALRLMIYHAVPGSEDHDRLVRLRDAAPSS